MVSDADIRGMGAREQKKLVDAPMSAKARRGTAQSPESDDQLPFVVTT
jgi:hypothetical protein